jgi:hypothetical protein
MKDGGWQRIKTTAKTQHGSLLSSNLSSVVDRHRFDANPYPYPTFQSWDAYPDPDPNPSFAPVGKS